MLTILRRYLLRRALCKAIVALNDAEFMARHHDLLDETDWIALNQIESRLQWMLRRLERNE